MGTWSSVTGAYNKVDNVRQDHVLITVNIYIFGVFVKKPYSLPLERNVVYKYIPITTLGHATSK